MIHPDDMLVALKGNVRVIHKDSAVTNDILQYDNSVQPMLLWAIEVLDCCVNNATARNLLRTFFCVTHRNAMFVQDYSKYGLVFSDGINNITLWALNDFNKYTFTRASNDVSDVNLDSFVYYNYGNNASTALRQKVISYLTRELT